MVLGQMGADVIKVEGRDGDSLRHVTGFRGWNQNKRGLGLDLKSSQGLEIAHALVKQGRRGGREFPARPDARLWDRL